MAVTHKTRYEGQFFSSNGRFHLIKIYDKNYTSATAIPITIGGGGVKIKYDTKGQEKFSPIIASKCSISLVVENNTFGNHLRNFIKDLRETYEEGDVTVVIWNTGSTSDAPLWSGNILIDLSSKEDVSLPYEVELNATDGLGLLRNYDMVSVQGSAPYTSADTYISDGYQTFIYWIKTILVYCNTPDSDSTDGDVGDYLFSTAVDWWYEEHPTASQSKSPLDYTQAQMQSVYEVTQAGLYKVKSVYDVLESICKMWGMRVVFWKNNFYFTQIELYNTADIGTYANPDNVDSQYWTKAGVADSNQDYLGNTYFSLYSQDIETNAGGFTGGLQKLAGSTWNYYPKLKEVSVKFDSISNNNLFTTFPQPAVQNNVYPNYDIDQITSSSLGTITGASAFAGFNLVVSLEYNNTSGINNMNCCANFSVRARPSGDTDWNNGKVFWNNNGTYSWITHPQEGGGVAANVVWYEYFEDIWANFGGAFFNVLLNPTILTLPSGTSQHTIFSGVLPQNGDFTGDWEFEIFTIAYNQNYGGLGGQQNWNGHHSEGSFGGPYQIFPPVNLTTQGVTYNDLLDSNGNPVSQFNPVYINSTIGASAQTSVLSARSETQSQAVKDIWWGDTITEGQPNSLIWDDGAGNTGYTDPNGKWRNGQSGLFNKLLGEVLGEARLFNQQQSDYKWSLGTAVSETNWWKSDGTGIRPVYINPVGRIHDTIDNIFYYLLRGTFNILLDEWESEWLQVSYDDSTTTTTTTTTTGGTDPSNNYSTARLGAPPSARAFQPLRIGSLTSALTEATEVNSIPIAKMNTDLFGGGDPIFEQNTLIKAGDVFNIESNTAFQQFTASADVGNTDTAISIETTTVLFPFPIGSNISINIRDTYQQGNHKTRGTIGGMAVTSTTLDGAGKIGRDLISFRCEGISMASGSYYVSEGEDNNKSGRWSEVNSDAPSEIGTQKALKGSRAMVDNDCKIDSGRVAISGSSTDDLTVTLYKVSPADNASATLTQTSIGTVTLTMNGNAKPRLGTFGSLSAATISAGDIIVPTISVTGTTTFRGVITFTLKYD